jgi:tetratricopeptide (TPR) repeat protein
LVAIDPSLWWDDGVELRRLTEWFPKQNNLASTVYISTAKHPALTKDYNPNIMDDPIHEFAARLKARNSSSFRSMSQHFEDENHGSVPPLSIYHGLRFVFEGYQPPSGGSNTPATISDQFANLSARLGVEFKPPEQYVNDVGYSRLQDRHDPDAAIEWFELNTANYPNSFNVYSSLAAAYEAKGDKPSAIANYEKSLQLKPDNNRNSNERLRRLKPSANAVGPFTNGVYELVNRESRLAPTVKDAGTNNGTEIVQAKYTGGSNQQWTLKNQGDGFYEITAVHSGKSLDINAESTDNGAKAIQWPFKDSPNQVWKIVPNGDGTYRLVNEHSGLALEATDATGTGGSFVHQWESKNRNSQKWLIKPVAAH